MLAVAQNRRTRSLLPSTRSLPEHRNPPNLHEMEQLQLNQKRQQRYYNPTAHDLPALNIGDTVRIKSFALGKHDWDKEKVTRRLDQRSYELQSHENIYRRNRQHLVKSPPVHTQHEIAKQQYQTHYLKPNNHDTGSGLLTTQSVNSQTSHLEAKQSSPLCTRSGRVIKEPVRFQDYICQDLESLFYVLPGTET